MLSSCVSPFDAVLIGSGNLALRCAEILKAAGHVIRAIITDDAIIGQWAEKNEIQVILGDDKVFPGIVPESVDYVFAIEESVQLDAGLYDKVKRAVIRYDPSVKYCVCGSEAIFQSILNRSTEHKIAWVELDAPTHAQGIIHEDTVDIDSSETAYSLIQKCHDRAADSFLELIPTLAEGSLPVLDRPLNVDPSYVRSVAVDKFAVIDWEKSIKEIEAIVRGLDFGTEPNPLSSAKLFVGNRYLLVGHAESEFQEQVPNPGTVMSIDSDELRVAGIDGFVKLRNLRRMDGVPLDLSLVKESYSLTPGRALPIRVSINWAEQDSFILTVAQAEQFWCHRLRSLRAAALPFVGAHMMQSEGGGNHSVELPLGKSIMSVLHAEAWDTQLFLLAILGSYFGHLNDREQIDIGWFTAPVTDQERAIELLYSNQIPLRISWAQSETIAGLIDELRDELDRIKHNLSYSRDLFARDPELDARLNQFPVAVRFSTSDDIVEAESGTRLVCEIPTNRNSLILKYSGTAISASEIGKLVSHLQTMIGAVAEDPARKLTSLPLLPPQEKSSQLADWNDTVSEFPGNKCIHELFEDQVARSPSAIAIRNGPHEITYDDLNARSNLLAHHLIGRGVQVGELVGFCIDKSPDLLVAMLGIFKAGAAIVPLDTEYPRRRIQLTIEDANFRFLLSRKTFMSKFSGFTGEIVNLDQEDPFWSTKNTHNPNLVVDSTSYSHLMYTSGSTGSPKGIVGHHRGVVNYYDHFVKTFEISSDDVVLQFASPSFDASLRDTIAPLTAGASIVIAEKGEVRDPALTLSLIMSAGITCIVSIVPTAVRMILRAASGSDHRLNSLRLIAISGEPLHMSTVVQMKEFFGQNVSVVNQYGSSECTMAQTYHVVTGDKDEHGYALCGRPIQNMAIYILNRYLVPLPAGAVGHVYIAGVGLTEGYFNSDVQTRDNFLMGPFLHVDESKLFKTGDYGRFLPDGNLQILGRSDRMIKIGGQRIELDEISSVLNSNESVQESVVKIHRDTSGQDRLAAYVQFRASKEKDELYVRTFLREHLPQIMVPSFITVIESFPRTITGKTDIQALPDPTLSHPVDMEYPLSGQKDEEIELTKIWQEVLGRNGIRVDDNFFDIGGNSLLLIEVLDRIRVRFPDRTLTATDLFQYPTIASISRRIRALDEASESSGQRARKRSQAISSSEPIAVIGIAGRFPGAGDVDIFWENLVAGKDTITHFSRIDSTDEATAQNRSHHSNYVNAKGITEGFDLFDASFFGYTPREASIMDPQHRLLLEISWHALEDAGYDPFRYAGKIGVFAGTGRTHYLIKNIYSNPRLVELMGESQIHFNNDKDYLTTKVSYKLGLTGPSYAVQTACSTSLVTIHLARESLLNGECDIALAGGVSLVIKNEGYSYNKGGIFSSDGFCRPFDKRAGGTVPSSGIGLVVLKRLSDAITDGDSIHAVIRGSAINNDGLLKVGYTAPSIEGQADVIIDALRVANVHPRSIEYVEAHGTGTSLGDPIEVRGLTQAYRTFTDENRYCAIGSVKSNIGHSLVAAGVAGFMKAVLSLRNELIPPTIHFQESNTEIDFEKTPFYVPVTSRPWMRRAETPRRAGVSSFGIGGTNAHVILEEAPTLSDSDAEPAWKLLLFSAKDVEGLDSICGNMSRFVQRNSTVNLADAAYTLNVGRAEFGHRRMLVCSDRVDALKALSEASYATPEVPIDVGTRRPIVFMFTGQGGQYPDMGRRLYDTYPVFRRHVDKCSDILEEYLGRDLRDYIYPSEGQDTGAAAGNLRQTSYAQPALFVIEYALAQLWQSWGVHPDAMIGHSIGEYVAACLSGVIALKDALALVAARGRMIQALPDGAMLAVDLSETDLMPLLEDGVSIAAINAPELTVVSGPHEFIDLQAIRFENSHIQFRRLFTSHAFHSVMMEPAVAQFELEVATYPLHSPQISMISGTTGEWITEKEATNPEYWASHMLRPIKFMKGIETLGSLGEPIMLEVGPGNTLTTLVRQCSSSDHGITTLQSLRHPKEAQSDERLILKTLGRLWILGQPIDWSGFYAGANRKRIQLPKYPFKPERHWVEEKSSPGELLISDQESERSEIESNTSNEAFVKEINSGRRESEEAAKGKIPSYKNELEAGLARIWEELMGFDRIDPNANFFELGGHSLMATQMLLRINEKFDVDLPVGDIFEQQSIRSLASVIDSKRNTSDLETELTKTKVFRF